MNPTDLAKQTRETLAINAVTKWCREQPDGSTPRQLLYGQRARIARAVLEAIK